LDYRPEVVLGSVGRYLQMFGLGVSHQVSVGCAKSQGIVEAAKCILSAFNIQYLESSSKIVITVGWKKKKGE